MTRSQAAEALLLRVVLFGATAFGVKDTDLPPLVRVAIPLAAGLVLAAMTVAEHLTRQTTTKASVAAAKVAADQAAAKAAQAQAEATRPATTTPLQGQALAAAMAAAGAAIEASRTGTLATAPQAVPGPLSPLEDVFPTSVLPAVPAVPVPA